MDELIDILDEQGNITGKTCMKSEAHKKGIWHHCIHVWLYTINGEVLIQKRIVSKDTFPNRWDVSVAGHIRAGEDILLAAQREVFEELGIKVELSDLNFTGNFKTDIKHNEFLLDREYHHVYISELTLPIEELNIQLEEVSEIKLIPISNLNETLINKNLEHQFVPYERNYFNMVFEAIKNFIFLQT
ncbi:NUDIX hydrolase [Aureibaculum conchae]|uniref:NUDIX hydrolase n=1 Tax=Aureibaculum sp. 2308TA14-22 TaxID=3108392 RepID=UPI0033947061